MADVKITALTAISANPVNPATFPMPMVDLLDNSMAASGSTRKVTVNQILGSGGTATLASATITGAATVGTTLGVTGVSTLASAVVTGALTSGTTTLVAHAAGYTGKVGIGTATPGETLEVKGTANFYNTSGTYVGFKHNVTQVGYIGTANAFITSGATTNFGIQAQASLVLATGALAVERYNIDSTGISTWSVAGTTAMTLNSTGLGIGTVPSLNSLSGSGYKGLEVGSVKGFGLFCGGSETYLWGNLYFDSGLKYANSNTAATSFYQNAGQFIWYNAPSSGASGAGTAATLTPRMTLDASGNLVVGTTVISPTINGAGAITAKGVAGITLQTVSALLTDYTLPIGSFSGILTIRSNGLGGSAVWMLDPNAGAVSISNNIVGKTITFTFSGGSWKMQQTVGLVPSTYNYLVLANQ